MKVGVGLLWLGATTTHQLQREDLRLSNPQEHHVPP